MFSIIFYIISIQKRNKRKNKKAKYLYIIYTNVLNKIKHIIGKYIKWREV